MLSESSVGFQASSRIRYVRLSFLNSCVFVYHFNRIRVDDSRIRNKNVALSNENAYAWTGSKLLDTEC